jgi:beta-glucosidase
MDYSPFEGAIEAGAGAVMCDINSINDINACQDSSTLNTDLRERLGFKGFVMSNWNIPLSMAIQEGLDQEQPGEQDSLIFTEEALSEVSDEVLDQAVYRILWAYIRSGILDSASD